jgi:class 3 adenylate cyclase
MDLLTVYLPIDRRFALVHGTALPDRMEGAALFADVSGFTPLTEALARELGPQRGAEELTLHLNRVFDALIAEVDGYHGSVVSFSGDPSPAGLMVAIGGDRTGFPGDHLRPGDAAGDGRRRLSRPGNTFSLAMKAVATGQRGVFW